MAVLLRDECSNCAIVTGKIQQLWNCLHNLLSCCANLPSQARPGVKPLSVFLKAVCRLTGYCSNFDKLDDRNGMHQIRTYLRPVSARQQEECCTNQRPPHSSSCRTSGGEFVAKVGLLFMSGQLK
jgi:hypothetical protein